MEAAALGLNLSCGFKFDPTDKDLVVGFLLPLVRGVPLLFNGGIIHDDPRSAPPWELLARHGRTEEAIFFAPGGAKYSSGSRRERGCVGGGMWKGQKGVDDCGQTDEEEVIRWRKYMLSYYLASARQSTGWVMHEFELTSPKCPQILLCRVRISEQGKKRRREQQEAAGAGGEAMPLCRVPIPDCSTQTDVLALEASQKSGVPEHGWQPTANYVKAEMVLARATPQDPWQESGITAMQHQNNNFVLADLTDMANFILNDDDMTVGMAEASTSTAFNGGNGYMGALTYTSNVKQFIQYGAANGEIGSVAGIVNSGVVHSQSSTIGSQRKDGAIGTMAGIGNCGAVPDESSTTGVLRKDGTIPCSPSNVEGFMHYGIADSVEGLLNYDAADGEIGIVAGISNCGAVSGEHNTIGALSKDGTIAGSSCNVDEFINYSAADGEIGSMAGIDRPGEVHPHGRTEQ